MKDTILTVKIFLILIMIFFASVFVVNVLYEVVSILREGVELNAFNNGI